MAVLGRLQLGSAERLDLPDLLAIDSYTASDFKYLIQTFIGGTKPLVLKGFDVIAPSDAIGTENVTIRVADSVVYYPGSKAGAFYYGLPEGSTNTEPLVPELRKNAVNFVYLTFSTFDTAKDSRAFWDPDQNGGDGGEFSQDVNTESVLSVEVGVSVSSFPENTIPVCRVTVGSSVISSIQDCRDLMFRLGSGGVAPNPFSNYSFREEPSAPYARNEPSTTMTSALDPNPFLGGDKNILTLKEWMDVVMTKLKEISGTTFWYQSASGGGAITINNVFGDALASTLKSKGRWEHSSTIPGQARWTQDIHYLSLRDPRDLIFRTSVITLADEEVAWIELIRDVEINNSNQAVSWLNASTTVNGITGAFVNLAKGDWTKKKPDSPDRYLRVEEFYALPNLAGGTTTPALAQSIRLSGIYAGTTGSEIGEYTKGEYLTADVQISPKTDAPIQTAGGNFFWIAYRSDTELSLAGIVPTQLTIDITEADGARARVTSTVAHGLVDGDRITIAVGPYANTYKVEVVDTDDFYIDTTVTGDSLAQTAFYAIVTTAARSTAYGYSLETAQHGFQSDEYVTIQGTSSLYDNNGYLINVRDVFSFQIPILSLIPNPGAIAGEIVVLPRMNVRTEFGTVKIVQGEVVQIGDADSTNIMSYVGMDSLAQTHPNYLIPSSALNNMIRGMQNYNSDPTDDLTTRAARLSAMMADKAQDKTVQFLVDTLTEDVVNTTNGAAQEITFLPAGMSLTLTTPGSTGQTTVTLPDSAPGISLLVNQVAYVDISRTTPGAGTIVVSNIATMPVGENIFIIASRLATTSVYLWDDTEVYAGSQPYNFIKVVRQNQMLKLVEGGIWNWDISTTTLSWSADAYIQVPGLNNSVNTILAGSVIIAAGQVAYVDINRYGAGGNLTVNVANSNTLPLTTGRLIIARREGSDVVIGLHSNNRLMTGEPQSIYGENNKLSVVRVIDSVTTSLPAGVSHSVDGVTLVDGDRILFTNMTTPSDNGVYAVTGVGVALVWVKMFAFNGDDLPYNGALVYVQNGFDAQRATFEYDGINWKQDDNADLTGSQTGFPNRTESTFSFDDTTMDLTIDPVVDTFSYYIHGARFESAGIISDAIPDTTGMHYFWMTNEYTCITTMTAPTVDDYKTMALVASVYWNSDQAAAQMVNDERHPLTMDADTRDYLHATRGTKWESGLSLAPNSPLKGDGSTNAQAQVSMTGGVIRDEDLIITIVDDATPTGFFEQTLSGAAELPVYYKSGVTGAWVNNAASTVPLITGTARPQYNSLLGDGLFLAVSTNGTDRVMYSTDGQTYVPASAAAASSWRSVVYAKSLKRWVAVADSGANRVMYSDNGINWTAATASSAEAWSSVTFLESLGRFVAVNYLSALSMYSDDGINWTSAVVPGGSWIEITKSEALGRFVAVSFGGRAMYSSDGIAWTEIVDGVTTGSAWQGVGYSEAQGLFVAVGTSGANRVMHSPDGITWTTATAAATNDWSAVTYSESLDRWVALAQSGANRAMYSSDAITWTGVATTPASSSWSSVVFSESLGIFSAVSESGHSMYSTTGTSWSAGTPSASNAWHGLNTGISWAVDDTSADGKFIAQFVFATNDVIQPVISIAGQAEYDSQEDAEARAQPDTLDLTGLPFEDMKCLYRLIFRTDSTYANASKAALYSIDDYRNSEDRHSVVQSVYAENVDAAGNISVGGEVRSFDTEGTSDFVSESFVSNIALLGSQTNTALPTLSFDHTVYSAWQVDYVATEAATGFVRQGTLRIISDGTNISLTNVSGETGVIQLTFNATAAGSDTTVDYSTPMPFNLTMKCHIKKFRI